MPAGGATGENDKVRVAAVVFNLCLDPGQPFLTVNNVFWKGCLGTEPIVDADADSVAPGHMTHERNRLLIFAAHFFCPGATVNLQ